MHDADFDKHDLVKWSLNETNPLTDQGIDWIVRSDMDYILIDFIGDYLDDKPGFDQAMWDSSVLYIYFDCDYHGETCSTCLKYDRKFEFIEMTVNSYKEDKVLLKVERNEI